MCEFSGEDAEAGGEVSFADPAAGGHILLRMAKIMWFLDDFLCGAF